MISVDRRDENYYIYMVMAVFMSQAVCVKHTNRKLGFTTIYISVNVFYWFEVPCVENTKCVRLLCEGFCVFTSMQATALHFNISYNILFKFIKNNRVVVSHLIYLATYISLNINEYTLYEK